MMLAAGRVVAAGPIDRVLTNRALSEAFGMELQLERLGNRWRAWSPQDRSS